MADICMIAGSPSRAGKSAAVLALIKSILEAGGWTVETVAVRGLPAEDLLHARLDSPDIVAAQAKLEQARAVIVATPIYKAAYSGVLKTFLDLLPQNALHDKIVLPLATGGSPAHLLVIDYALKPVLGALGATHILRGVYLLDTLMQLEPDGSLQMEAGLEQRLQEAIHELSVQVRKAMG